MHKFEFPEKHPIVWTCLCVGTVGLPQWLSGTWALFSDEPLAVAVARSIKVNDIPFSPYWITVPIGLVMFGYLAYVLNRPRSISKPEIDQQIAKSRDITEQARSFLKIRARQQPLLKIEYKFEEIPHEGFFNWFTNAQGKNIQRYKIRIRNVSSVPVNDVEVKLETIERLEDEMCGIKPISLKQVGYPLTFEKSGLRVMNIHGHDSEWVPVLSYESQIFGHVSIEGIDRKGSGIDTEGKIMSPHNPHRIKIVVRGVGIKEDAVFFFVRLESVGGSQRLIMKQLEP
jgi:hypothetical protein